MVETQGLAYWFIIPYPMEAQNIASLHIIKKRRKVLRLYKICVLINDFLLRQSEVKI